MYRISYKFKNCYGDLVPVVLLFATEKEARQKAVSLRNCRECKDLKVEEASAWRIG